MMKLIILISNSGKGSNLQAIINAIDSKSLKAKISGVISDTNDARGLIRAKKHKITTEISRKPENLLPLLQKYRPDFICLTGWKQIIPDSVLKKYQNKILNIHPGIIPDTRNGKVKNPDGTDGIWNRGKFTTKAIDNFLKLRATYAGSSVHFLTHEFDFGPVLGRTFEKIKINDTIDSLYLRLKKKENLLFVKVLQRLCN